MRHLWSLLAGVVAAPLTWVLITLGQDGSTRTVTRWLEIGKYNTANLIEPSVYLAVAGILLGLLGTLRVSPLGPLIAGLALITPYVGLFVDPFRVRDTVPTNWKVFGDPLPLLHPVENGTLFFLGALLLMAVFSGQRWRRWPAPAPVPETATATVEEPDSTETFTRTDWSALQPDLVERDTAPPTLGYPDPPAPTPTPAPVAPTPLPRRADSESPWSAPPRSAGKTETPPK
ncbi:hypothetical protein [Micromonospora sp. NBC_01796]|uniref:hypothetical protein n=1 Tax=Micromonospora sp. NBC_01796 TaxID=2975987 RepID=UPI002DD870E9|nr:hypothetical protein [Micromonospora sp. NBC_01796]WSA87574.1 hypothetical protein OIE47_08170 [Micromonospora sp. NBC_01796]